MLTCLPDVRNLSLSLYTLKLHCRCIYVYIYISLQEHTQELKNCNNNSAAPQTTSGTLRLPPVLKGRCKRVGGYGVNSWACLEDHPIWRMQLWSRKLINIDQPSSKWLGSWTNPPSDKLEINLPTTRTCRVGSEFSPNTPEFRVKMLYV